MHPADIQCQLKKRGITQVSIAHELGVSAMHISAVIRFQELRASERVMKAISKKIGRDPRAVFPTYFFRENRRTKKRTKNPN